MNPLAHVYGQDASQKPPRRSGFLYVIDGEVSLELEDKVFVLQTSDSAHDQLAAP